MLISQKLRRSFKQIVTNCCVFGSLNVFSWVCNLFVHEQISTIINHQKMFNFLKYRQDLQLIHYKLLTALQGYMENCSPRFDRDKLTLRGLSQGVYPCQTKGSNFPYTRVRQSTTFLFTTYISSGTLNMCSICPCDPIIPLQLKKIQ